MNYVIDTNIILDSVDNIILLSDKGSNTIYVPEVALDECDNKKSGFEDINYNARQFARLLEESVIESNDVVGPLRIITTTINSLGITIKIVSKEPYTCETTNIALSILNDRKILEVTSDLLALFPVTFISLDIMCRTRALSLGIPTETLTGKQSDTDFTFHKHLVVENAASYKGKVVTTLDPDYQLNNYSYTIEDATTGQQFFCNVANNHLYEIKSSPASKQFIMPINLEQKFFYDALTSPYYDLIIADALAGSGKSVLAIGAAMQLVRDKKYGGIVYIRNSIESLAKGEDVGYLPGLEEKFKIYNHPLYDSLRFIAKQELVKSNHNRTKASAVLTTEEAITAKVEEYTKAFNIQTVWVGELRGRTISNAVVIIDEIQNCSGSTGQLIISRLDKDCKAIAIGSNRQIDNLYTNKYINSLSLLLNATPFAHPIRLFAAKLSKVVRGPLTEFAESIFSKH